jgi:hypothetical protein
LRYYPSDRTSNLLPAGLPAEGMAGRCLSIFDYSKPFTIPYGLKILSPYTIFASRVMIPYGLKILSPYTIFVSRVTIFKNCPLSSVLCLLSSADCIVPFIFVPLPGIGDIVINPLSPQNLVKHTDYSGRIVLISFKINSVWRVHKSPLIKKIKRKRD